MYNDVVMDLNFNQLLKFLLHSSYLIWYFCIIFFPNSTNLSVCVFFIPSLPLRKTLFPMLKIQLFVNLTVFLLELLFSQFLFFSKDT